MSTMTSYQAVRRFVFERPEWVPVLRAAITVAKRSEPHGGEFSGRSVVNELSAVGGPRWVNNLRTLVTYGLIEKADSSARRTYYRMPARAEIERALAESPAVESEKGRLRFIGVGASSDPPVDTARRAGEIAYEPRSWR
jgi:hypothetical protein